MKIHVPSMPAKSVETINKQTQQTSSHHDLENITISMQYNYACTSNITDPSLGIVPMIQE